MPGKKFLCGLAQHEGIAQVVAVIVIVVLHAVIVLVIVIVDEGVEWFPSMWS